jgi:dienelactone hydrolase
MNRPRILPVALSVLAAFISCPARAAESTGADRNLNAYFRAAAARLSDACLADVQTLADWRVQRDERRRQLFDMLGLWPNPPRTALNAVVTGKIEREDFTVEKLHYQSMPGLYVTANLYLPHDRSHPAPAILYVCGHAEVKTNGVSFGNKTAYQHHGIWFARHGYVCLVLDTLQLGEIQGDHHGTYRLGQWWWNARGYTPAGVEAWNSIRALDYLGTRPEVDATRIGMTGRSGGGSYTWTTAALDERIKVAAPVAGITDLQNQVVDGCVEGHCDCMFFVNTYCWDFPLNAALLAPRPLLIVNTDSDDIFPLDGVERLHARVKRLYQLYGATNQLGLVIGPGGHKDTQNLQVPVLRWFNHFLKGQDPLIEDAATPRFQPAELRVFEVLPSDQLNTRIAETFVPQAARSPVPSSEADAVRCRLLDQVFRGWPTAPGPLRLKPAGETEKAGLRLRVLDFESQDHVPLQLFVAEPAGRFRTRSINLHVLDAPGWTNWLAKFGPAFAGVVPSLRIVVAEGAAAAPPHLAGLAREWKTRREAQVWFAPRGIGPDAWSGDEKKQIQIRRRFMLVGQTLDSMRVWDIRRAIQAVREIDRGTKPVLTLEGSRNMGVNVVYASLFETGIGRLDLPDLPASHRDGPDYLNVLKVLDIPEATAWARARLEQPGLQR